jgi:hypothetical protein
MSRSAYSMHFSTECHSKDRGLEPYARIDVDFSHKKDIPGAIAHARQVATRLKLPKALRFSEPTTHMELADSGYVSILITDPTTPDPEAFVGKWEAPLMQAFDEMERAEARGSSTARDGSRSR